MKIIPIQRSNLQYLAALPEDCEITAMCEHKGIIFIATDKNKIWSFDIETLKFEEIK